MMASQQAIYAMFMEAIKKILKALNQPTTCEEKQGEMAKMAAHITDEIMKKVSQLIPSTLMTNGAQSLDVPIPETSSEDRASIEGKFGWTQFGNNFIPYIMRSQEKYVALQTMNYNVFYEYMQLFKDELYSCFEMEELKMTKAEAKLLNDINFKHCDNSLGPFVYPDTGRLISLNDAEETYEFFNFCSEKLVQKSASTATGGFMKPTGQGCIPYVWIDSKRYVPLFYLDGKRLDLLEQKSIELKGWKLAYMKLFCKIQGIGKHLFEHSSIRVIDLEVVKKYFLSGTILEESWPTEHQIESLIVNRTQAAILQQNERKNTPPKDTVSPNAQTERTQGMNKTAASVKASSTKNFLAEKTARPNAASENASFRKTAPTEKRVRPKSVSEKPILKNNASMEMATRPSTASEKASSRKNAPAEKATRQNATSENASFRKNAHMEKRAGPISAAEKAISKTNAPAEKTVKQIAASEKCSFRQNAHVEKKAWPISASEKAISKHNAPAEMTTRPITASEKASSRKNAPVEMTTRPIATPEKVSSRKNSPAENATRQNATSENASFRKNATVEKKTWPISTSEKAISKNNAPMEMSTRPSATPEKASSRKNAPAENTTRQNATSANVSFRKNAPVEKKAWPISASEKAISKNNPPVEMTTKPIAASVKPNFRKNAPVEQKTWPISASEKAISKNNTPIEMTRPTATPEKASSRKKAPAEKAIRQNSTSENASFRINAPVEKKAWPISVSEKAISKNNAPAKIVRQITASEKASFSKDAPPEKKARPNPASEKSSSTKNSPAEKTAWPTGASEKAISKRASPSKKLARLKPLPYSLANKPDRFTKDGNKKNIKPMLPGVRPAVANSISSMDNVTAEQSPLEFLDKSGKCKFHPIPDFPFHNREPPYFLLRSQVENRNLNFCINLFPYNSTVLMILAEEIATGFFNLPLSAFVEAVNFLRLKIYMPNKEQTKLFEAFNVYPTGGLIKLSDFTDNMSNIKTMMWCYKYN